MRAYWTRKRRSLFTMDHTFRAVISSPRMNSLVSSCAVWIFDPVAAIVDDMPNSPEDGDGDSTCKSRGGGAQQLRDVMALKPNTGASIGSFHARASFPRQAWRWQCCHSIITCYDTTWYLVSRNGIPRRSDVQVPVRVKPFKLAARFRCFAASPARAGAGLRIIEARTQPLESEDRTQTMSRTSSTMERSDLARGQRRRRPPSAVEARVGSRDGARFSSRSTTTTGTGTSSCRTTMQGREQCPPTYKPPYMDVQTVKANLTIDQAAGLEVSPWQCRPPSPSIAAPAHTTWN